METVNAELPAVRSLFRPSPAQDRHEGRPLAEDAGLRWPPAAGDMRWRHENRERLLVTRHEYKLSQRYALPARRTSISAFTFRDLGGPEFSQERSAKSSSRAVEQRQIRHGCNDLRVLSGCSAAEVAK